MEESAVVNNRGLGQGFRNRSGNRGDLYHTEVTEALSGAYECESASVGRQSGSDVSSCLAISTGDLHCIARIRVEPEDSLPTIGQQRPGVKPASIEAPGGMDLIYGQQQAELCDLVGVAA
jgi:hypothetical protein